MDYTGLIVIVTIITVAIIVVSWVVGKKRREERAAGLTALAQQHGWQFVEEDESYAQRWRGRPFRRGGRSRHVVLGEHRGRQFCAFSYRYTTSNGKSSQTHYYTVWAIGLPGFAPDFSVAEEGVFGGKIAEALGFARIDIDDESFNDTFKVKCDDERFGRAVLDPAVVELLKRTGPWSWRLTENSMLSFQKGVFEPERLLPRLDLMSDLLDRIPESTWLDRRP